jgi:hypothetical protein
LLVVGWAFGKEAARYQRPILQTTISVFQFFGSEPHQEEEAEGDVAISTNLPV